jgi:hypothetical protein
MKRSYQWILLSCILIAGFYPAAMAQVYWEGTVTSGTYSSAIGYYTQATNNYSFAAGQLSKANGIASISLGYNSTALGNYSVAIGQSSYAVLQSYAIGQNAIANGQQSLAIGRFVETGITGMNSIILGSSVSGQVMRNNIPASLMIGFNSTIPTVFVGPSSSYSGIGKVGIGTTSPQAGLHVKSLAGENASLFLELGTWGSRSTAIFTIGNTKHGITADPGQGLSFQTEKFYVFNEGNVGVGTYSPQARLHVDKGNTLLNGDLQVGNSKQPVTSALYGRVGIGTDNPLTSLQVNGSVSIGFNAIIPPESNSLVVSGPVGIGTFSPSAQLEVVGKIKTAELQLATGYMNGYILQSDANGNATWVNPTTVNTGIWQQNGNNITVDNTKKVGIGTSTPAEALHIKGNMLCSGNIKGGRNDWQSLGIYANSSETDGSYILMGNNSSQTGSIKLFSTGTSGRIEFHNQNIQVMSIRADNNVYFGDPDVATNLYVNGEITSSLVRVNTQSWWDCVFKDDYQLTPLSEVEAYIKEHQHLPDLPSEEEVRANGIDVAQMNALLLKKIEELTLYVIELEKKVNTK